MRTFSCCAAPSKRRVASPRPTPLRPALRVNAWVKQASCWASARRFGRVSTGGPSCGLSFVDKHTFPARHVTTDTESAVTGGSAIRAGAYVAPAVVCAPPMYINTGSYVDEGTMVDSHALVGPRADRKRVPPERRARSAACSNGKRHPALLRTTAGGRNSGVYEGTIVRKGAVLQREQSSPAYPGIRPGQGEILQRDTRSAVDLFRKMRSSSRFACVSKVKARNGLSLYGRFIVKYREERPTFPRP